MSAALKVASISADNRGEDTITFNQPIKASSVSASTFIIYTPGKDKKIGTGDDQRIHAAVTLDSTGTKVTIHGRLDIVTSGDLGYRIRLIAGSILSTKGKPLTGSANYKVTSPSGNPTARFSTSAGVIKVSLYKTQVATTVNNFIEYVNHAYYDNTIIHRNVSNFIIQGGGYSTTLDSNGLPTAIATFLPIKLQAGISNTTGTIAMARTTDPNSATSQWFFNATDNTTLDKSTGNDGYAVFGKTDAAGIGVILTINSTNTVNLTPSQTTAFNTVPESNGQFVTIRRVALIDTVTAI